TSIYSTTLIINEIIDLEIEENSEPPTEGTSRAVLPKDLDYEPCDVLNRFLEREKQKKPYIYFRRRRILERLTSQLIAGTE
ncbi:5521_t:CDS:2, partial [Gigaspora rosea]